MSMLSDDLAAMFADTSLTVSVAAGTPRQTTQGFLATSDEPEMTDAGVTIVRRRTVTVLDGSLPDLASGAHVIVDGVTYRLHGRPRVSGRGKLTLILAEVVT